MLGIDHPHASWRETKPGADPGFLEGSKAVRFEAKQRRELYEWVNGTLSQQGYERLGRASKGLVRKFVAKMTGLSRAQVRRKPR